MMAYSAGGIWRWECILKAAGRIYKRPNKNLTLQDPLHIWQNLVTSAI